MMCPNCHARDTGHAIIREQSEMDVALDQQRRAHKCSMCGYEWDTIQITYAELVRLRVLAHRAVMAEATK